MNKSYRIVWNHVRNCLMVVSETTKSRGKGAASKAVVETVAAAVMALGSAVPTGVGVVGALSSIDAQATAYNITTNTSTPLDLASGDSVDVATSGTISTDTAIGNEAVAASGISGVQWITNSGLIQRITPSAQQFRPTILISNSVLNGGIFNSGSIWGYTALQINHSTISGGLVNTGSIGSNGFRGVLVDYSSISGISNTGTIRPLHVSYSTIGGDFVNNGLIADDLVFSNSKIDGSILNTGKAFWSLTLQNTTVAGSVSNSGTIEGVVTLGGALVLGSFINS